MKFQAALQGKNIELPDGSSDQENSELTPEQKLAMDKALEAAKIRKRLEKEHRG